MRSPRVLLMAGSIGALGMGTIAVCLYLLAPSMIGLGSRPLVSEADLWQLPVPADGYGSWSLSPDGDCLAATYQDFGKYDAMGRNLRLVDLASGDILTVTHQGKDSTFWEGPFGVSWLPDGSLAVQRFVDSRFQRHEMHLWRLDPRTQEEHRITQEAVAWILSGPAWSPDGRWAIFPAGPQDGIYAYLMLLDRQSGFARRVDLPLAARRAEWSPDGKQLAIVAGDVPSNFVPQSTRLQGAIYVISAQHILSSQAVQQEDMLWLAEADLWGFGGTAWVDWSPDRRWLVFEWTERGNHGIWIVASSGNGEPMLLLTGDYYAPTWFPDGNRLLLAKTSRVEDELVPKTTFYAAAVWSQLSLR